MTDTRLPEHYLTSPQLDELDDAAFRVFINGLMWSVTHGKDGALPQRSLRWLHPDVTQVSPAAESLVACGLWTAADDGYAVTDYLKHQTPAATVEHMRAEARKRKERQRRHERGDHSICRPEHCPKASQNDVTRDEKPGHNGTGRVTTEDRTGQAPREVLNAGTSRADESDEHPDCDCGGLCTECVEWATA